MWVNDRFDEGRRVVELSLKDGRKLLDRSLREGRSVIEHRLKEGRDVLDHSVRDGRGLLDERLKQGRHALDHSVRDGRDDFDRGVRDGRKRLDRGLDDGRKMFSDRVDDGRRLVEARFADGRKAATATPSLWPILLVAAGAGGAFWWWTQWSRGKAEAEARAAVDKREGGGEAPIAHPEMVMAHHEAPAGGPSNAVDPSDDKLVEPAEQLMMHAPVDDTPVAAEAKAPPPRTSKGGKTTAGKAEALATVAGQALASAPKAIEESLGVQGAASGPKPDRTSAPTPSEGVKAAPSPRSKGGPTIM